MEFLFSRKKGLQNAGVDAKIFLARGGLTWDVTEVMLVHQDEAPNIYAHISKARPLELPMSSEAALCL